jgi:hypothetical protein
MATLMSSQVQSRRALPRLRHSESLSTIISQGGPLPEEQVWAILDQLLANLEQTHAQGKCHRCFSLSTIGVDSAGELEIASTDVPLTISDLIRLHSPLPSALRHEFELVIPRNSSDAAISLAHAGFGADGAALDLFQIAVLAVRLVFDVDGEKFLASPCLQETLPPALCGSLKSLLSIDPQFAFQAKHLRAQLPGASPPAEETPEPRFESQENPPTVVPESLSPQIETAAPLSTLTTEIQSVAENAPLDPSQQPLPALEPPPPYPTEPTAAFETNQRRRLILILPVLLAVIVVVAAVVALAIYFAQ